MFQYFSRVCLGLCFVAMMFCVSCSNDKHQSLDQFDNIQKKITRGEQLTAEEQAVFDRLNNVQQIQKDQSQ